LIALPLLLLYEVMILVVNQGHAAQIRVGADVWLKQVLSLLGGAGTFALGLVVLLVGIWVFMRERKKNIPLRPRYFGWMIGESAVYAVLVALLVANIVGLVFSVAPATAGAMLAAGASQAKPDVLTMLALSIGAGLYEELLFRVILVGGMYLVLRKLAPDNKIAAYFVAALVGAVLFSAVHYIGPLGDPFALPSFAFRFLFGLVLNVIFLVRGFGVAAWTHALYDVMVVTHLLG
jgi:hypothetical protein